MMTAIASAVVPPVQVGLFDWWEASAYDNAGNWRSWLSARVLAEATNYPSKQSNVLNGCASVRFDGTNDRLIVASSTATYKFLHDGTGATVILLLKRLSDALLAPIATGDSSAVSDAGYSIVIDGRVIGTQRNALYWQVGPLKLTPAAATIDLESAFHIVSTIFKDARSPNDLTGYQETTSVASGDNTLYSSGNAARSLALGHGYDAAGTAINYSNMDCVEILIYNRDITTAEFTADIAYLRNKYNI